MYHGQYVSFFLFFQDIDQLTRILTLCGTPNEETLSKITSEEVHMYLLLLIIYLVTIILRT